MKALKNILWSIFWTSTSVISYSQCSINFDLGNDTTVHCGDTLTIQAPFGLDSYAWNTGSSQSSISVSQSGTYTCYSSKLGANLVSNGDFSSGNNGFTSSYTVGTGGPYGLLSYEGTYAVSTSPSNVHNNFVSCTDHTSSSGNMMVINGAAAANVAIWQQTISVQPNTNYQFSTWATSVTSSNPGQLQFKINNQVIGSVLNLSSSTCSWQHFFVTWNSGSATTATIAIINLNTNAGGNDFAIDDIQFSSVCQYSDNIVVTIPPRPIITVNTPITICKNQTAILSAQSSQSNITYSWQNGTIQENPIQITATNDTIYTVQGTDSTGCTSLPMNIQILVNPLPIVSFSGDTVLCDGQSGTIHAHSSIPNSTFNWSSIPISTDSITITPTTTTSYPIEITSPLGCVQLDTIMVVVEDQLQVSIAGKNTLCEGDLNSLNATSNYPNTQYIWLPSNNNDTTIQVGISDTGWVYLTGSIPSCGSDLDSILIKVGDIPIIQPISNDTICKGTDLTINVIVSPSNAEISWQPLQENSPSVILTPEKTTTYTVVANIGNCLSEPQNFTIVVNPICDVIVPNVFSPNGDEINDYFSLIDYQGIAKLNCKIFNRWGNLINEFNTPEFKWNGKSNNGIPVADGTYFYIIKATITNGHTIQKNGPINLIR